MTAKATAAPPIAARKAKPRKTLPETPQSRAFEEADLRRWSPEEVVEKKLLPYTSVRVLKEKCYRREVYHHNDAGRITFSPESIRLENARTIVAPAAA